MSLLTGELYAYPLSKEQWEAIPFELDPYVLGHAMLDIRIGENWVKKRLPDINLGNRAEYEQPEVCNAWIKADWPYEGIDFLWEDKTHCRAPSAVAAAADSFVRALEVDDKEALWFVDSFADRMEWSQEECLPLYITTFRNLAGACRWVAQQGATLVTVFVQS